MYQESEKLIDIMFWGILLGLLTEVIKQILPGGNMDLYDGIADTLGIIVGYYIYRMNKLQLDIVISKLGA